jgi:alkaline phosphatase
MTLRYLAGEESLADIVAENVAFKLTVSEIELLNAAAREEDPADEAIAAVFNQRTHTGWTSDGHTGVDVPLYATGPGSARFHGVMQNEDLGRVMWEVFLPE